MESALVRRCSRNNVAHWMITTIACLRESRNLTGAIGAYWMQKIRISAHKEQNLSPMGYQVAARGEIIRGLDNLREIHS
jgi:hypothetical protein